MMQFVSMSKEIALERKAKSSIVKDLFYYLVSVSSAKPCPRRLKNAQLNEEENENAQPLDLNTITNEAALVIIAGTTLCLQDMRLSLVLNSYTGSDTTSSALAHAFFNLVTNMDVYDRLRKEVDTAFPAQLDAFDTNVLASLPMLQAVM